MVKRDKEIFFRFKQLRNVIKKFAVALAFVFAFVFMLLTKSENVLIEKTSGAANEIVSAATDVLVSPASLLAEGYGYLRSLRKIDAENRRLREENRRLIMENARNRATDIENRLLAQMLNYAVLPGASFVTAKVVAEEGSAFAHAVTVYTAGSPNVRKGLAVIGSRGIVGRVEKCGPNYARIFLVNDINSKIPVMTEESRVRGVLAGDNTPLPKMIFIPLEADVKEGDKIVTSGLGGVVPPGLPVGVVIKVDKDGAVVRPYDRLNRLEYVQIVDYHLPDPTDELFAEGEDK